MIERNQILSAIRQRLEPEAKVLAMWEGGAAAFNRVDEWSDIDLMIDVEDDAVERTIELTERALESLAPIDIKHEIPQPTWHGHYQAFYRLKDASPFAILDFVVIRHSNPNKFIQPEMHGNAKVHFDKIGLFERIPHGEGDPKDVLRDRVETLSKTFPLFQVFSTKEVNRQNWIEALAFYNGFTLRPLVELLRIIHCPDRYNFHTRYVYYDLPADVVSRLENLFFVSKGVEIETSRRKAEQWFQELLGQARSQLNRG